MLPEAPARLSTTTCCPHASERSAASRRATRSTLPPGGNGVMMRTGLAGKSAANTVTVASIAVAATKFVNGVVCVTGGSNQKIRSEAFTQTRRCVKRGASGALRQVRKARDGACNRKIPRCHAAAFGYHGRGGYSTPVKKTGNDPVKS